jgi:MFS family permease
VGFCLGFRRRPGSFYGHIILAIVWLIYFANVGFFLYSTGAITARMTQLGVLDSASVGAAVGLWTVMQGVCGPIVGHMIADRGIRLPFIFGNALLCAATLLIGLLPASPALFIVLYGFGVGSGMGIAGILTCQSAVNEWFEKKKPLAMGVALSSGGIGGFVLPLAVRYFISHGGWRHGWLFISGGCALLVLVSAVLLVDRPGDIGQHPDGEQPSVGTNEFNPGFANSKRQPPNFVKTVTTRHFLSVVLNYSGRTALYYTFSGHIAIYLLGRGVDYSAAVFVMSLVAISSLAARLAAGFLAERFVASNVLLGVGNMFMATGTLIVVLGPSVGVIFVGAVIFGIGGGLVNVALPLTIAVFYGTHNFSIVNGWITPVNYLFGALGPLAAGFMAVYAGGYLFSFVAISIFAFAGGIAAAAVKPPGRDN